VNTKLRQQLRKRNQKIRRRIDKRDGIFQSPAIRATTTTFELSEKTQAISCGGIGVIMQMVKLLDLRKYINDAVSVFKLHLPYDEADHVLNIAMNLLAGGTCLEHIELRRTDEAYLNALGAERIPDPTTAGDFCRRFDAIKIMELMQGESYAEFDYQPLACDRTYRMVVVHKDIKVMRGQQHLFDKQKYFFSITNELKEDVPAREVIRNGNQRCDQENS